MSSLQDTFGDQVHYARVEGQGTLEQAAPHIDAELVARAYAAIEAAQQGA